MSNPDIISVTALPPGWEDYLAEVESQVIAANQQSTNHEHDADLREYFLKRANKLTLILEFLRAIQANIQVRDAGK